MFTQRVILANGSRLVRELLRHVVEKSTGFEVVREVSDLDALPALISETNADWLFVALPPGEEIPESLKAELFYKHPTLRIVGFWTDGSQVKMEWLGRQERDLSGLTLNELSHLLRDELRPEPLVAHNGR